MGSQRLEAAPAVRKMASNVVAEDGISVALLGLHVRISPADETWSDYPRCNHAYLQASAPKTTGLVELEDPGERIPWSDKML